MPVHGGFIRQCSEFVDPAFGFAIGINFWFAVRPSSLSHVLGPITNSIGSG
jgi:amino acid permease